MCRINVGSSYAKSIYKLLELRILINSCYCWFLHRYKFIKKRYCNYISFCVYFIPLNLNLDEAGVGHLFVYILAQRYHIKYLWNYLFNLLRCYVMQLLYFSALYYFLQPYFRIFKVTYFQFVIFLECNYFLNRQESFTVGF